MFEPNTEPRADRMRRRGFLGLAFAGGAAAWVVWNRRNASRLAERLSGPEDSGMEVTIVEFADSGARQGTVTVPRVVNSDAEWRQALTPAQFHVARKTGTEPPFSGEYDKLYEEGVYRCICCGTALFSSETKFASGTGWPSFWQPIAPENVRTESDSTHFMVRTEALCRRCDAHLGHVFDDGPPPTGLRYCINSVSLQFVKRTA